MFKNFFKKIEDDDVYEKVDPVLEQRRNEKFSKPLIYDEEFKDEPVKDTEKKPVKEKPKPKAKVEPKKPIKVEEPKKGYEMMEIISPMFGSSEKKETKVVVKDKVRKPKRKETGLIQVISPFYGDYTAQKEEVEETVSMIEEPVVEEVVETKEEELPTVESNLRNIAKIVEENEEEMRIIEERTGEFKFEFPADEKKEKTLIEEINDNMSLDELMNLYEKKFKD